MKLLAGDILLFYGGKSWISKLIQWGTGSKYHHTGAVVCPENNMMIEAQAGKLVRAVDIRKLDPETYDVYRIKEIYSYDINKFMTFLVSRMDAHYDYAGVFYLGILKVLRLKDKANRFQRRVDLFCSEILAIAFAQGNLNLVPGIDRPSVVSPGDIANSEITEKI